MKQENDVSQKSSYVKNMLLHKLYKLFGRTKYFADFFGIKAYNKPLFKTNCSERLTEYLDQNLLFIGFDGLKDSFTLLDTPVISSPHFELVRLCKASQDISDCDYCLRTSNGSLDGRFGQRVDRQRLESFAECTRKTIADVENDDYDPILVYRLSGKTYIPDGKHRAACALLEKRAKCIFLEPCEVWNSYTQSLLEKSAQSGEFSRNTDLLTRLCEQIPKPKPRILFLISVWRTGGTEKFVVRMANAYKKKGL